VSILTRHILAEADYARVRDAERRALSRHRAPRRIALHEHCALLFESRWTVLGQIQEVCHVEGRRTEAKIQREIDEYSCLIPRPDTLTATLTVHGGTPEFGATLSAEAGAERGPLVLQLGPHFQPSRALRPPPGPDAVHYLAFDLGPASKAALYAGAPAWIHLRSAVAATQIPISPALRLALEHTLHRSEAPASPHNQQPHQRPHHDHARRQTCT